MSESTRVCGRNIVVVSSLLAASSAAAFLLKPSSSYNNMHAKHTAVTTTSTTTPNRLLTLLLGATASPSSPSSSAEVSSLQDRFRVGDYYVWMYKDKKSNTPTSWERYKIVNSNTQNQTVVIEMASKFTAEDSYITHHRMTIDLKDQLNAIRTKHDWKLLAFEYRNSNNNEDDDSDDEDDDEWTVFGVGDNVQAFEEKFDVFSMLNVSATEGGGLLSFPDHDNSDTKLMVSLEDDCNEHLMLTRSERHKYTESWYAPTTHRDVAGVAMWKDFSEHSFSLIENGREGECGNAINIRFG